MANENPRARRINIIGTSARAAAHSAVRAGFLPAACDRFGDADLRRYAVTRAAPPLSPASIGDWRDALASLGNAPWMYTGGFDRRPELLAALDGVAPLWGNGHAVLDALLDVTALARAFADGGLPMPETRTAGAAAPARRGWLVKPLRGGQRIVKLEQDRASIPRETAFYYQREVAGTPCSAVLCACPPHCRLLGMTRQLVGEAWLGAPPFTWCGNIGPIDVPAPAAERLLGAATLLVSRYGLRGLFGIDFVLASDPRRGVSLRPVDVNPRYTASIEVLEHAGGLRALEHHASAFREADAARSDRDRPGGQAPDVPRRPGTIGKAVIFADRRVRVPRGRFHDVDASPCESFPTLADIPVPGTIVERGQPLLTVFARGDDDGDCLAALRARTESLLARFSRCEDPSY